MRKEVLDRLSKISTEDLERAEACKEWVADYQELKLNKNTVNRKETVLYWKSVFEEELPEFILKDYYKELSTIKIGMLKLPFYNGSQIDDLQRVLTHAFVKLLGVHSDLAYYKFTKKTLQDKREEAFPTPKVINKDTEYRYKAEKKLVAPAHVGSREWIDKFNKIPGYNTSGIVLQNIQPLEEISDGGPYKLNIYGKLNGYYPITIMVGRNIKVAKNCNSMQEAYNVGLSELKKLTKNPILPNGI